MVKNKIKIRDKWTSERTKAIYWCFLVVYFIPQNHHHITLLWITKNSPPDILLWFIMYFTNTPTYALFKHLNSTLTPFSHNSINVEKDSYEFKSNILKLSIKKNEKMTGCYVASLYTSIPIDRYLDFVDDLLENDNILFSRRLSSIGSIMKPFTLCQSSRLWLSKRRYLNKRMEWSWDSQYLRLLLIYLCHILCHASGSEM